MNWKKLPKEKRSHLILVVIITLTIVIGLGYGLIRYQYDSLKNLANKRAEAQAKLQKMQDAVKHADRVEADFAEAKSTLITMEEDMASGDLYAWVINTLRKFKLPYKVEMPQFSPIGAVTDVSLLPDFPYKQTSITVAGTAHFHDLGRFLADFENEFPHMRVLNLRLDSNGAAGGSDDAERLSFSMEIVTLVKSNQS